MQTIIDDAWVWGWTPDTSIFYGPYYQNMVAYGLRAHVPVSAFFLQRYAGRTLKCKMILNPNDCGSRPGTVPLLDLYGDTPLTGHYGSVVSTDNKYTVKCNNFIDHVGVPSVYDVDIPIVAEDNLTTWFEIKPKLNFGFYCPVDIPLWEYGNAAEFMSMAYVYIIGSTYNPLLNIDPMGLTINESFDII